jgi:hypothetical protein
MQTNGPSDATSITERTNAFTGQYAVKVKHLANELGLPVVDLWTEMQKQPGWQIEYLEDGLHFTSAGNKAAFDLLMDRLCTSMPHLRYEGSYAIILGFHGFLQEQFITVLDVEVVRGSTNFNGEYWYCRPEVLPDDFPSHRDIDEEDPARSLAGYA